MKFKRKYVANLERKNKDLISPEKENYKIFIIFFFFFWVSAVKEFDGLLTAGSAIRTGCKLGSDLMYLL